MSLLLAAASLLFALQGCVSAPASPGNTTAKQISADAAGEPEISALYRPAVDATTVPDLQDAEKTIRLYYGDFVVDRPDLHAFDNLFPVSSVKFENDAVLLEFEQIHNFFVTSSHPPARIPYASLKNVEVVEGTLITKWIGVKVAPEVVLWQPGEDGGESMARAKAVANAMFSLYKFMIEKPAQDARFAETAEKYRRSNPKPVIPEAVYRFNVIALTAVREKRFRDAANAYDKGLKLAPWWREGQFNAALMYGELHDYSEAIDHMQKYVALVPAAPNARAAQDKVYEWESELGH